MRNRFFAEIHMSGSSGNFIHAAEFRVRGGNPLRVRNDAADVSRCKHYAVGR